MQKTLQDYFRSSAQSLFFSRLNVIKASRKAHTGQLEDIWSIEGERFGDPEQRTGMTIHLKIHREGQGMQQERWLVCSNRHSMEEIPEELLPLFGEHRMPTPITRIAINVTGGVRESSSIEFNSRLFASMPLPITVSLPVHLDAPWILSDDRRSLRYDVPDARGHRPLDAKYNEHLLRTIVPTLYMRALGIVALGHHEFIKQCWPGPAGDPVSEIVVEALYRLLRTTNERVLRTVIGKPVAPKSAFFGVYAPSAVMKLVKSLPVSNVVDNLPFDPDMVKEWSPFRTDSGSEIASILRNNVAAVAKYFEADPPKTTPNLETILRYMMREKENLVGLPLLKLGDDKIVTFQSRDSPKVFCSNRLRISQLFGLAKTVSKTLSSGLLEALCQQPVNLQTLDATGLRELLKLRKPPILPQDQDSIPPSVHQWYNGLILLMARISETPFKGLGDLPVILTSRGDRAISFNRASRDGVWWRHRGEDEIILPILDALNIPIISLSSLSSLFAPHDCSISAVLQFLDAHTSTLRELHATLPAWDKFAEWVRNQLRDPLPGSKHVRNNLLAIARRIPLFAAVQGSTRIPFACAMDVVMLPQQASRAIGRFLPSTIIFARYSNVLRILLGKQGDTRSLTIQGVMGQLALPNVLAEDQEDIQALGIVMEVVSEHVPQRPYMGHLVPDEDRVLRAPGDLYDGNQELFRQSFGQHRPHLFVHPDFYTMMDRLVDLGVHQEVTIVELVACARAINEDTRAGENTYSRAEYLWRYINEHTFLLDDDAELENLASLRFIPTHVQRHPHDPNLSRYARELPRVVTIDEVCEAAVAPTVWTQRAMFAIPPRARVTEILQGLGRPTPKELVRR